MGLLSRLAVVLLACAVLPAQAVEYLELTDFHLVDGTGAPPREVRRLVAREGIIVAIDEDGRVPEPEPDARWLRIGLHGAWVMPGLIDTPMMANAPAAFTDAALAEIPLGRVGRPEDIAPTIVFLVSDDSAYYNGAEIVIDGGLTAHVSHKRIADATRTPL